MENWLITLGFKYLARRLREPSTWAAIAAALAGSLHVQFNGDFSKAFISAGLALAAVLGIILNEGVTK